MNIIEQNKKILKYINFYLILKIIDFIEIIYLFNKLKNNK